MGFEREIFWVSFPNTVKISHWMVTLQWFFFFWFVCFPQGFKIAPSYMEQSENNQHRLSNYKWEVVLAQPCNVQTRHFKQAIYHLEHCLKMLCICLFGLFFFFICTQWEAIVRANYNVLIYRKNKLPIQNPLCIVEVLLLLGPSF